jgi:hypothetical protein
LVNSVQEMRYGVAMGEGWSAFVGHVGDG